MKLRIASKFVEVWYSPIVAEMRERWEKIQKEIITIALQRHYKNPVEYLLKKFTKEVEQQGRYLGYSALYSYIQGKESIVKFSRFADRISITKGQYKRLWKAFRYKFFWLSLINNVKTIEKIKNSLDRAIEDGIPRTAWIEKYLQNLEGKTFYAETVFRTNLTSHYNLGVMDGYDAEYFEYVAILDERTTEICHSLNGKIFHRSQTNIIPPNHYNCRSVVVPSIVPYQQPIDVNEIVKDWLGEYKDFLYEIALVEIPPSVWETIKDYVSADLIEKVNRELRNLLENE
ncbi:MAG: minor capsid protein [Sulfolobales archaeon]